MIRLELLLLGLFSIVWLAAIFALFGLLPVAGSLDLDLYRLYSVGAVLGWLSGNVYMARRQRVAGALGHSGARLLLVYLVGPPGFVYLLRAMAPQAAQQAAPFVPIYAFAVYCIFFLVPLTLRVTRRTVRRPGDPE